MTWKKKRNHSTVHSALNIQCRRIGLAMAGIACPCMVYIRSGALGQSKSQGHTCHNGLLLIYCLLSPLHPQVMVKQQQQ